MVKNSITDEPTDAITNAANNKLKLGGGVAGAIRTNGGPTIQEECNAYIKANGLVPAGQVAVTGSGTLKCRYVIHAVGPRWNEAGEADTENINKLKIAILNILTKANEIECESVSIPAVSSGIFGFPKPLCA